MGLIYRRVKMPKNCAFVDEEGVRCGITPTYNNRGETKPLYCNTHRLDNMVFVTNTQCIYDGCLLRASFNYQGKNNRLYCSIHRLDGMVNLNCKKCIHEGCELYPTWNYEGQTKRLYCKYHHLEGMVIVSRKPCIYDGCKTLPNYKEWDARLERLREQVEYWTNPANATEKTVEIVELFYDCDS